MGDQNPITVGDVLSPKCLRCLVLVPASRSNVRISGVIGGFQAFGLSQVSAGHRPTLFQFEQRAGGTFNFRVEKA